MQLADIAHRIMLAWGWRRRGIAFFAGAASALAMAPLNRWPVLAITFPVFVWLLDGAGAGRTGLRTAFFTGWWFGFGYFLAGLYWIGMAFLVDAEQFAWLMPFAVIGLPMFLALFTGLAAAIARYLWSAGAGRIFAFALALTIADWLRGHVLTGFPWNSFGYALGDISYFSQGAAYVGLWGLTLFATLLFATPATLIDKRRTRALPVTLAALALVALAGFGFHRLSGAAVGFYPNAMLRIMQPNLSQDERFRTSAKDAIMDRYASISDRATSPQIQGVKDVTHLFWPESAFPFFLEREADMLARISKLISPGTILVTGAARAEEPKPGEKEPHYYNSIRVIAADGSIVATYDKVHLVPFGEFLPFQNFLESLGLEQLTRQRGGFSAGQKLRTLNIPGLPPAAPLICYEAIFPGAVIPDGPRPAWMLNVSNDAWFGLTPGPYQHLAQARLRAVEEGLPLVRATNNGISAVIDPFGKILKSIPLGQEGVLDSKLPMPLEPTFYAKYRDLPALALAILFGIIAFAARAKRSNSSRLAKDQEL
jgi:apolipoprotein N-acyltransferase